MASNVGKIVGVGGPAAVGAGIGFALGGPVGALIGGALGGLLGIIGVGAVEEKERQAKAQTDPFLQEKREVIRRLLQMSPYLPDVSYSDFARMLGIEDKRKTFVIPPRFGIPLIEDKRKTFVIPPLVGFDPSFAIMTGLASSILSEKIPFVPFATFPQSALIPQIALISETLMSELKKENREKRK
jgi:hypothetical protein